MKQIRVKGWMTYGQASRRTGLAVSSIRVYAGRGVLDRAYLFGEFPVVSEKSVSDYMRDRAPAGNPDFQHQKRSRDEGRHHGERVRN